MYTLYCILNEYFCLLSTLTVYFNRTDAFCTMVIKVLLLLNKGDCHFERTREIFLRSPQEDFSANARRNDTTIVQLSSAYAKATFFRTPIQPSPCGGFWGREVFEIFDNTTVSSHKVRMTLRSIRRYSTDVNYEFHIRVYELPAIP